MTRWRPIVDFETPMPAMGLAPEVIPQLIARSVAVFLCASIVLVCATTQGAAQVPSRPVETPSTRLTKQLNRAIGIAEHGEMQQALVLADRSEERRVGK